MRRSSYVAVTGALACFCLLLFSLRHSVFARISVRNIAPLFRSPARVTPREPPGISSHTRLAATWIGHSSVLLKMDDAFVLTDPVLTERVGVVSKRLVEPGLPVNAIPLLRLVLVSHRHLDHLSPESLAMLEDRVHMVVTPPDVAADLPKHTYSPVELAPWQRHDEGGLQVTAVPVLHEGGRLWHDGASHSRSFTGYVLRYHKLQVYFPGDTAWREDLFREVRQRFGPMDLALMPIGPITPVEVMTEHHMNPMQAIALARILGAKMMLPIHFETFVNSLDPSDLDRRELIRAEQAAPGVCIVNWRIGETVDVD